MKRIILTLITFGISHAVLTAAETELKGTVAEIRQHLSALDRSVTVLGEAEVKSPADRAVVTLRLSAESRSLHDALKANQALRTRLISALTGRSIGADRIDAGKFSSTPRNWIFSEKVKNYKVETLVKVTVLDERELQETARLLDELNGLDYAGMEFEHSKKEELKRKALAQALESATARKKIYEEQLGVALTPLRFSENLAITPSRGIGMQGGADPSSGKLGYSAVSEGASGFGEKIFTAQVAVHYSILPR